MIEHIPPAIIFFISALLIPLLKGQSKKIFLLTVPILAFIHLLYLPHGEVLTLNFLDYKLIPLKVDPLSLCFGYVFIIFSFASLLFALNVKDDFQHTASLFYIGSALGVIFSGDFFSLFIFWEIMAIGGCFLIITQREKRSLNAGIRYILVHFFGGCCLLAGIVILLGETDSLLVNPLSFPTVSSTLIFVAFILNAAVPPLHAWLTDSYPEATITGAVFLTAYTTKSAVYVLARVFPGVELLIWLGAIMAMYGVIFAVLENDIRRLLAYHIVSQVGYMVCGVGIGTQLAINGAVAHAFSHILYKGLLFMGTGAVIYVTGKRKLSDLQGQGLYKILPVTLILYMIGAYSISGVPLFNGFISKSITISAAAELSNGIIYLLLLLASVGTFLSTGLKLPYFTWFGITTNSSAISFQKKKPENELPLNMLLAMGFLSLLCVFFGCYPRLLYDILPYPFDYHPYTRSHIIETIVLLLWTAFAFKLLRHKLKVTATITLDTDWFYRMGGRYFLWLCKHPLVKLEQTVQNFISQILTNTANYLRNLTKYTQKPSLLGLGLLFVVTFLALWLLIQYYLISAG